PVSDYLTTPPVNLAYLAGSPVTLRFMYAFNNAWVSDRFSVVYRVSPDSAWNEIYKFPDPMTSRWDWKELALELPEGALKDGVQLAFYYTNGKQRGGGAAVDHVELFAGSASTLNPLSNLAMRLYPNPTDGQVTLEVLSEQPGRANVRIFNIAGQVVTDETHELSAGKWVRQLDLSQLPKGVYTLVIKGDGQSITEKITLR
ncbi:MAG: T9SS type A sorting domain-containing protein, partial [Bacteroidales bacterium]